MTVCALCNQQVDQSGPDSLTIGSSTVHRICIMRLWDDAHKRANIYNGDQQTIEDPWD